MTQNLSLPESEFLICRHISDSKESIKTIQNFSVSHPETGSDLERYLKNVAIQDEADGIMRTYLVHHKITDECVGYFSLKAGLVSTNEITLPDKSIAFDTFPGVELSNFALNRHFQDKFKRPGLGGILFRKLITPFVLKHAATLGINVIYLFALPYQKLIATYEKYGFHRLPKQAEIELHRRIKPYYDKSCVFMFQPLSKLSESISM